MRRGLILGLMWGIPAGMAICRVLDHLEKAAHLVVRPRPPIRLDTPRSTV